MTEPQARGTDRNEAAERLRNLIQKGEGWPDEYLTALDAALDWERRRTVDEGRREAELTDDQWFTAADRLCAIIESRMSNDLAWLDDDGKTIIRLNPEEAAYHLTHLYRTGDAVSGLPPLGKVESER